MINENKVPVKKPIKRKGHPFHIVEPSPWPILTSMSVLCITVGAVCYMHREPHGGELLLVGLFLLCGCLAGWFSDIINEATYRGMHTLKVQRGIAIGMKLFIVSEVMFFVGFFWAYFYFALDPSIWTDCTWPPRGIPIINPFRFPLVNTFLLLTSGAMLTVSHLSLKTGDRTESLRYLKWTLLLGANFTLIQVMEYAKANFFISDGIYGSCFYMLTGFHGLHVIVGTIFLCVCYIRNYLWHFTYRRHLGFVCAIWYWHFVDVVWIFLYVFVYLYGYIGTGPELTLGDLGMMRI